MRVHLLDQQDWGDDVLKRSQERRSWVSQRYSWDAVAKSYLSVYEQSLRNSSY
jgi:hypothetical protein